MTRNKENPFASRGNPFRKANAKRIVPFHERVKRFYPAAKCAENEEGWHVIYAMNGTGNELACSQLSADDAWRRAWTYIEKVRP